MNLEFGMKDRAMTLIHRVEGHDEMNHNATLNFALPHMHTEVKRFEPTCISVQNE
jgi:hypothetical protein